jgi:hypothetical protein
MEVMEIRCGSDVGEDIPGLGGLLDRARADYLTEVVSAAPESPALGRATASSAIVRG